MSSNVSHVNSQTAPAHVLPYEHRRAPDGTWSVIDMRSGYTAAPGFLPVIRLSSTDAKEVATILNRDTVRTTLRLHRYAI